MRDDLDDDRPIKKKFEVQASSTGTAWAFAIMMIIITIIVAACCLGSIYIARTT